MVGIIRSNGTARELFGMICSTSFGGMVLNPSDTFAERWSIYAKMHWSSSDVLVLFFFVVCFPLSYLIFFFSGLFIILRLSTTCMAVWKEEAGPNGLLLLSSICSSWLGRFPLLPYLPLRCHLSRCACLFLCFSSRLLLSFTLSSGRMHKRCQDSANGTGSRRDVSQVRSDALSPRHFFPPCILRTTSSPFSRLLFVLSFVRYLHCS